jgi:hypothetical protein
MQHRVAARDLFEHRRRRSATDTRSLLAFQVKPPHKPDLEGSSDTAYFKLQLQKEDLGLFAFMDE